MRSQSGLEPSEEKLPLEPHERQNIRNARKLAGLTGEKLAEIIGRSSPFISMIETGASGASMTTLRRIAAACGVELFWLFVPRSDVPVSQPLQRFLQGLEEDGDVPTKDETDWLQWVSVPGRRMTAQAYAHALALYRASKEDDEIT